MLENIRYTLTVILIYLCVIIFPDCFSRALSEKHGITPTIIKLSDPTAVDIEYKQWGLEWKVEFDITVTADAGQRGGKMNVFNMMGMYFPVSTLHNKVKS